MAVIDFKESYQERLIKANQAMIEAYEALDPESEDYFDQLDRVSSMAKEVNTDFKNYGDLEANEDELEATVERDRAEVKSRLLGHVLTAGSILATLVTFFVGERNRNNRINQISRFEDENAVLKMSDKISVQDALREDQKPKGFPFFK